MQVFVFIPMTEFFRIGLKSRGLLLLKTQQIVNIRQTNFVIVICIFRITSTCYNIAIH